MKLCPYCGSRLIKKVKIGLQINGLDTFCASCRRQYKQDKPRPVNEKPPITIRYKHWKVDHDWF